MFNKTSYLVLISVFILIFGLTCVSAAQDNMTTDNLAVDKNVVNEYAAIDDDSSQDDLISKSSDEKVVSENPSDEILSDQQTFGNVTLYIADYGYVDTEGSSGTNEIAKISSRYDSNLDGQITLSIDNNEYYNKIFYGKDYYSSVKIYARDLNLPDNLKIGFHNVTLSYLENGKSTPYTINSTVEFKYPPKITPNYGYDSIVYTITSLYGNNGNFTVYEYIKESGASHSSAYKGEFISSGIISNGKGEITINDLTRTFHSFNFYMVIDGQNYEQSMTVSRDDFKAPNYDEKKYENESLNGTSKTFTELNKKINSNNDSEIYLDSNYTFRRGTDGKYMCGIPINRDVTIYGNGYTLDGNNAARIFRVTNSTVTFKNIIFANGKAMEYEYYDYDDGYYYGGAIDGNCTAVNCTFVNNHATYGGALAYGSAVNCIFNSNSARGYDSRGGAMYRGSAVNCTFVNNSAASGRSISGVSAVNCTFDTELVDPKIVASNVEAVYAAGSYYTIKVYGKDGKLADGATVKITGKISKTLTTTNGIAKFKVTQLPGTYKIKITALGKSLTKTITVKHLVTLKTVAVKKSAKKLVLQASLGKVNGKYLNKKIVTFKFNGKTYKAKTNSKGVAKYTLKSSVLKNLKVGKKITYQATYLKDTVKKTAKVKR